MPAAEPAGDGASGSTATSRTSIEPTSEMGILAAHSRAAKQDQGAVEKLMERAGRDAVRREMRALEEVGLGRKRHGPC